MKDMDVKIVFKNGHKIVIPSCESYIRSNDHITVVKDEVKIFISLEEVLIIGRDDLFDY